MTDHRYTITLADRDSQTVGQRLVAETLDDAQQLAADLAVERCGQHYTGGDWTGRKAAMNTAINQAFDLPDEGGTIGTLPDGSTITVAPVPGHDVPSTATTVPAPIPLGRLLHPRPSTLPASLKDEPAHSTFFTPTKETPHA